MPRDPERMAAPPWPRPTRRRVESDFSTFRHAARRFGGQVRKAGRQLVDKSLVQATSNIYSKSCPKGPTFTVELAWGAIPGAVPGDRAGDRKAAGHGAQRWIDDHEQSRSPVRQSTTAGSSGRFVVRPKPKGAIHAVAREVGAADPMHERLRTAVATHGAQRTPTGMRILLPRQRSGQFSSEGGW